MEQEPKDKKKSAVDLSGRWWRQVGFWTLTIQMALGLPALFVIPVLWSDADLTLASSAYMAIVAAWVAAAGIRQWGKNRGSESHYDYEGE